MDTLERHINIGGIPVGHTIALVDDDRNILTSVTMALEAEGFDVRSFTDGDAALRGLSAQPVDLAILDIKMPRMDGMELLQRLRKQSDLPVIFLTSKDDEVDEILGLRMGADDYVTKPFSVQVFLSRVRAVLRRKQETESTESDTLNFADLKIHLGKHEVRVKEELIKLTYTEFMILEFLSKRPGWVFTRGQIVDAVRGDGYAITDRAVDFQIVGLRINLGAVSKYIETVRGVGYRFAESNR